MRITMSGGRYSPHLVLVVTILLVLGQKIVDSSIIRCTEKEREALLVFKQGLVDARGTLSSWDKQDDKNDYCKWRGVLCNNQTGHVEVLDLQKLHLKGTISPTLLKLHHLSYLDLSYNNFSGSQIPGFIGSLSKMRHLSLSGAGLGGPIPRQLGNLSRLQYLDLSDNDNLFSVGNLEWFSHLSSLEYLDLSSSNLSKSNDWFQQVEKLPFLKNLLLNWCNLPPIIPSSDLLFVNSTASLEALDLSHNSLTSSINSWLFNVSSKLVELYLAENNLQGPIPDAIGNMIYLRHLSLESSNLEGGIPKFFGNMCSLQTLNLPSNHLSGFIINLLDECTETALQTLNLGGNQFMGSMPDLERYSSLIELNLEQNHLNGTLTESIGQLFMLRNLRLGGNLLKGVVHETLFSNLHELQDLDLAGNSLALEFRQDWIPPFQLEQIRLGSCKMGPHFPKWLQSQKNYFLLDISNAGISDTVPDWIWDLVPRSRDDDEFPEPKIIVTPALELNLSHNHIKGTLPDLSQRFSYRDFGIDISSNQFEGPIPALPAFVQFVNLSKNKFSGMISFLCSVSSQNMLYIDLSSNLFSGRLPDCLKKYNRLVILDLANNGFSGNIPHSMGVLTEIKTLSLRNNNLSGDLPSSLKNCTQLRVLDLGKNALSGKIPAWIGESLPHLVILCLQSNRFLGNIPFQLCHLADIQILDLSLNNISGTIPNCVKNFTAMTEERSLNATITNNYVFTGDGVFPKYQDVIETYHEYFDSALLRWKGNEYEYKNTLGFVKIIDLSSNVLGGTIPREIMSLIGLIALNLSRNHLTGQISEQIHQLQSLDFLDLSRNQLFGEIPSSFSLLNRLSILDLSNNNLSGKIPLGTQLQGFNASVYFGNPRLCGLPLSNECSREVPAQNSIINNLEDANQIITLGFYVSMLLGFIVGFWGVCGTLVLNNSWRHAYFNFLTSIKDWFYVTIALTVSRLQRRLSN